MFLKRNLPFILMIILCLGITGMLLTIVQYFSFNKTVGFLFYKQPVVDDNIWLTIFYVHVFTCVACLIVGITQFSKVILQKHPKWHRFFGRMYFYNVVFINFPAGFVLAIHANGHTPGKLAFITLDMLWLYFTVSAVLWVRRGNVLKHRNQMIRSYAMTLTALTLRLLKMVMSKYSDWTYDEIYVFDAWTALVINLAVAETIIYSLYLSKRKLIAIR
jgi:uncharacterized membrane protein